MGFFVPVVLDTLNFTLALLLVTLGLVVIYGLMNVINMAHGEFFLLGAYCVVLIQRAGLSFWWTLLLAPSVLALVGLAVEELVIRHVYRRFIDSDSRHLGHFAGSETSGHHRVWAYRAKHCQPNPRSRSNPRRHLSGLPSLHHGVCCHPYWCDISFLLSHPYWPRGARRDCQSGNGGVARNQHSTPRPFDFRHRCRSRRGCGRCHGTDHERRSANGSGVSDPGISLDSRRRAGHAAGRAGRHSSNLRRYYDRVRRLDAGCSPGGRLHDGNRGDPRLSSGDYGASVLRCPRSFPVRC